MKNRAISFAVCCFLFIVWVNHVQAGEDHHHEDSHVDHGHKEDAEHADHAVKMESDDHGHGHEGHGEEVHLKIESQEMIGLEFAEAKKTPLLASVEVFGEAARDSENTVHVTSERAGEIKKISVAIGAVVEKGTALCSVQDRDGTVHEMVSPSHGVVMAVYVKEGDTVDEVSSIMTIVDPDVMKAGFNLYEKDLDGVSPGQQVKVKTVAYPEKEFTGEIVYISPQIDMKTRAVKLRVDIANEEHLLKFGMYLTGEILIPLSGHALVVPEEALQTIEGSMVVFVPEGGEKEAFLIREVKAGRSTGGVVEILEGLSEGEIIVGKGSFYLKAEMQKGELGHGHAH